MRSDIKLSRFTTIDDVIEMAQVLLARLKLLGDYKYPLDVRRGVRKGVDKMSNKDQKSKTLEGSGKTFFFDIQKARTGNPYLKIAESRAKGEKGEAIRNTIMLFPEDAQNFADTLSDMVSKLLSDK